jgi:hypothetical protein
MELTCTRKALRNKSVLLDLITPHTCDDSHLENITDAPKPIKPSIVFNDSAPNKHDLTQQMDLEFTDKRDSSAKRSIKSTAPAGILNALNRKEG